MKKTTKKPIFIYRNDIIPDFFFEN